MSRLENSKGLSEREYYETQASESEFLDWYHRQELPQYDKPSVTTDMVAYAFIEGNLKLLVIKRKAHPFKDKYALVGGFLNKDESAVAACIREVKEEVNLSVLPEKVEQLMTISTPHRDPRGWVISIAHLVYLPSQVVEEVQAGDDAKEVIFLDVDFRQRIFRDGEKVLAEEDFAFDHYQIILESIERIQGRMDWNPTFLHLLDSPFTVYEATDLINLITPHRPIVSNNFLIKYGVYVEEAGVKRVPKKKPRKVYRFKGLRE